MVFYLVTTINIFLALIGLLNILFLALDYTIPSRKQTYLFCLVILEVASIANQAYSLGSTNHVPIVIKFFPFWIGICTNYYCYQERFSLIRKFDES